MRRHVAFLRAVNLGPTKRLPMDDLVRMAVALGFSDARTVLQTGNLVFTSPRTRGAALERLFEAGSREHLGFATDYHVRSAEELAAVVAANPYRREAESDPSHLLVAFLRDAPHRTNIDALRAAIRGRETVDVCGREAYLVYPDGIGESKLTMRSIEKALGTSGTARNWNTVRKLVETCGTR
jgi:uncharacterized protein (DUF1697 family)